MKNSIKKISMSVIAGTLILGNISTVGAASCNLTNNLKNTNFKNLYTYKYKNCKYTVKQPTVPTTPTKPAAPNNNNTTPDQNNQVGTQKPTTDNSVLSVESEVLRLVNVERSKAGLSPLKLSTELSNVARMKSQDMADKNYFDHNSPTYGSPFDMMKKFGINYTAAGENIAKGYSSAEAVMNGWMNSPGHKANILSSKFGTLGVGYVNKNGTTYWTQMFTN